MVSIYELLGELMKLIFELPKNDVPRRFSTVI